MSGLTCQTLGLFTFEEVTPILTVLSVDAALFQMVLVQCSVSTVVVRVATQGVPPAGKLTRPGQHCWLSDYDVVLQIISQYRIRAGPVIIVQMPYQQKSMMNFWYQSGCHFHSLSSLAPRVTEFDKLPLMFNWQSPEMLGSLTRWLCHLAEASCLDSSYRMTRLPVIVSISQKLRQLTVFTGEAIWIWIVGKFEQKWSQQQHSRVMVTACLKKSRAFIFRKHTGLASSHKQCIKFWDILM